MAFINEKDPDLFVNIINGKQNGGKEGYDEALKASTTDAVVPLEIRKEQKPHEYAKIVASVALILALSFISFKVYDKVKSEEAIRSASTKMATYVKNNTIYGDFNPETSGFYWWYDIGGMAKAIMDSQDYDIDTRIYGCFINLKEYQRMATMDDLFTAFQKMIASNPNLYSDDLIAACNFSSFQDYLASKNLTLDEYLDKMPKILISYGQSDSIIAKAKDELDTLKNTGGSR